MNQMRDDETRCKDCGMAIDRGRFGGLCPSCLLGDACEHSTPYFAGYELVEEIARGGMGVVYRARQLKPARQVALKCLSGSLIPGEELKALFEVEAAAMATIDHPAVLPIYQFGEADGFPFFTMKLAGGGSLSARLAALSGDWRGITRILLEMCDVLRYMHERGMFHRDIKPSNILFDDSGRVFLADFGIVRLMASDAGEAILRSGTPAYVAPEVTRREDYTALSDLWGLGAVMWEMLSGRPPFHGKDRAELLSRINTAPPDEMLPGAPLDLVAVARKLLEKQPRDRYASAAEVESELRSWLAGKGVQARPRNGLQKFTHCIRRNPVLAALSLVVALLAISFLAAQLRSHANLREAYGISLLHQSRGLRAMDRHDEAKDQLVLATRYLKSAHARDLRTEAAALMASPGWSEISRLNIPYAEMTGSETFTPDLDRFLMAEVGGSIGLRDFATGDLIESIPARTDSPVLSIMAGDDAKLITARHYDGSYGIYGENVVDDFSKTLAGATIHPLPDSRRILHLHPDMGVWLGTLEDPYGTHIAPAQLGATRVVMSAKGEKVMLVVDRPARSEVRSLDDGRVLAQWSEEARGVGAAAFSPDGRLIAICGLKSPFSTRILDATTGVTVNEFADHRSAVSRIAWHPSGDSIATVANGENLVWRSISPAGWRLQRPATSRALAFSSDGERIGYCPADGTLAILKLTPTGVFQTYAEASTEPGLVAYRFDICPAGKWLAVSESSGVRLWNHGTRVQADHFRFGDHYPWGDLKVDAASESITGFGLGQGIWKISIDERKLTGFHYLGEKQRWIVSDYLADDDSLLVMEARKAENGAWIWPGGDPGKARKVSDGFTMVGLRNIPGTDTGYSTHWNEPDVWIWDFATGKRIRQLGVAQPCAAEPDPGGKWLLVSSQAATYLFDAATWEIASTWPTDAGKHDVFTAAFSENENVVAQGKPDGTITLREIPSGRKIISLTPPSGIRLQQIRFHGNQLIGMATTGAIVIWDLKLLREELGKMELDW